MHQSPGFRDNTHPDYVCHLQKSLYALKQAPGGWFQRFTEYITLIGFVYSKIASLIFRRKDEVAYLLLYVDDIILTTSSSELLQRIITMLSTEFSMTDLGLLSYLLGVSASPQHSGLFLFQCKYALEPLERAHMSTFNPCRTPTKL